MADALDLGSSGYSRAGSTPAFRTITQIVTPIVGKAKSGLKFILNRY